MRKVIITCGPDVQPTVERQGDTEIHYIAGDLLSLHLNTDAITSADVTILIDGPNGNPFYLPATAGQVDQLLVQTDAMTSNNAEDLFDAMDEANDNQQDEPFNAQIYARDCIRARMNALNGFDDKQLSSIWPTLTGPQRRNAMCSLFLKTHLANNVLAPLFRGGRGQEDQDIVIVLSPETTTVHDATLSLDWTRSVLKQLFEISEPGRSRMAQAKNDYSTFTRLMAVLKTSSNSSFIEIPSAGSPIAQVLGASAVCRVLSGRTGKPVALEIHRDKLHVLFVNLPHSRDLTVARESIMKTYGLTTARSQTHPPAVAVQTEDTTEDSGVDDVPVIQVVINSTSDDGSSKHVSDSLRKKRADAGRANRHVKDKDDRRRIKAAFKMFRKRYNSDEAAAKQVLKYTEWLTLEQNFLKLTRPYHLTTDTIKRIAGIKK